MSNGARKIPGPRRVIIRGFRDKPVDLTAVEVRDEAVDVVGTDPKTPMPFQRDRVFAFNQQLYKKLSDAFSAGNVKALASLWERAERFEPKGT